MITFPINPLDRSIDNELLHKAVVSIFESYHAPDQDLVVEVIQNAVDAVDERADLEGEDFIPRIVLQIDDKENSILIADNGVGIPEPIVAALGTPHNTDKVGKRKRGHKGVGLTYVAWSTDEFWFATKRKDWDKPEAGLLSKAYSWVEGSGRDACPMIEEASAFADQLLEGEASGTVFKFVFPRDSKALTTLRRLSLIGVSRFLRTKTALGLVALPELDLGKSNDWATRARVNVSIAGHEVPITGFGFAYPHEFLDKRYVLSLDRLRELPGASQEKIKLTKRLIYKTYTSTDVEEVLGNKKDSEDLLRLAKKQHVAAYIAFVDHSATIGEMNDSLYKAQPGAGRKRIIVDAGIQVATVGMPVGQLIEPELGFGTGNRNRLMAVVDFDEVSPDFGRKTFESEVEQVAVAIVEHALRTHLVPNRTYLIPRETAHGETATEQVETLERFKEAHKERKDLRLQGIGIRKEPQSEQEVVALFHALLASKKLPGYTVLNCPGSISKYDALVDIEFTTEENGTLPKELQVGGHHFPKGNEALRFRNRILEFKYQASSLVADIDADAKTSSDIHLLVCWEGGRKEAFDGTGYEYDRLQDFAIEGEVPGQTHKFEHGADKIWTICLKDVVDVLARET